MSLYRKLGHDEIVKLATDLFYDRILKDDRVNYFFNGVNIQTLIRKQITFMIFATGGPIHYPRHKLRESHVELVRQGLDNSHFEIVKEHLFSALADAGVKEDMLKTVRERVESVRDEILCR